MYGYIYKNTYLRTNKIYIGQHKYNKAELDPKYHGSGAIWSKIYESYPELCIEEIIDTANSAKELNEKESYWIEKLNSIYPNGYNITTGGGQCEFTIPKSEEERLLHSIISKQNWEDPNYRKCVTENNKKTWSDPKLLEEHSKKMSEIFSDPEIKKEISQRSNAMWSDDIMREYIIKRAKEELEKHPERREVLREKTTKNWEDPEFRNNVTENNKKTWSDPDLIERQSKITSKLWEDDIYRERTISGMREAHKNPETKEKHRINAKNQWKDQEQRNKKIEGIRKTMSTEEYRKKIGGKNSPHYKKQCPLRLYVEYILLDKNLKQVEIALGIGHTALGRSLKEYGITKPNRRNKKSKIS